MSENTTDNKKFLGLKGLKLVLNNLKEKYSPLVHTHDDLYYTETEVDELLLDLKDGNTVVAKAEEATHATNADKATNAEHSDEATHAINADNAINAENATKATQDASGNVITDTYETKEDATAKLAEAKEYANTAATTVKNDLLNGAGEAYDTLQELGALIDENVDAIEALETVAINKADKEHTHSWDNLEDKPFYDTRYTEEIDNSFNYTFDGNLEGREYIVDGSSYLIKLSNTPLTKEELIGSSYTFFDRGRTFPLVVEESNLTDYESYIKLSPGNMFSVFEDSSINNVALSVGLWIVNASSMTYISSISKTDIQTVEYGELKQLDEKYIPDTIARVDDLVAPTQSDWNESDETALSFIKNRTHYDEPVSPFIELGEKGGTESCLTLNTPILIQDLRTYSNYKNISPKALCEDVGESNYSAIYFNLREERVAGEIHLAIDRVRTELNRYNMLDTSNFTYNGGTAIYTFIVDTSLLDETNLALYPTVGVYATLLNEVASYVHVKGGVIIAHTLDKRFIPSAIARVEDITTPIQSDWNQNDETAIDYVKNRTHYDTRYTEEIDNSFHFTFDGNLEGREYVQSNGSSITYLVKLSDTPLTKDEIMGSDFTFIDRGQKSDFVVTEDNLIDNGSYIKLSPGNMVSVFEECDINGDNFSVGLWIIMINGKTYISSISKTDIQIVEHGELKQLDEKYIPDTITREGHVHSYNDLTDRTHYEEEKFGYLFEFDSDEGNTPPSNHNGSCTMAQDSGYRFIEGETYTITTVDKYGVEISGDVICVKTNAKLSLQTNLINSQNETLYMHFYQLEDESSTTIYGEHDSWINSGGRSMLKLYGYLGYELKQLDEKYIPDSIARDNTFVITLINNGDGTYSYDKTFEELLMAHVTDKKDLRLDSSCIGMPYPNFLPFTGNFGGGVQFSACVDDNSTNPANSIPLMVGVTLCPGQYAETFQKDLFGTSVGLLDTTDKTIIGAINEVNEKVDNALVDAGGDSVFIVTVTENEDGSYSADKTFAEIVEAHENGKIIVLYDIYSWSLLTNLTDNELFFGSCIATRSDEVEDIASFFSYVIDKDNVIHFNNTNTAQILDDYFESMCSNLTTTDKTIVGAINELNAKHTDGTYTQEIVNEVLNALPTWTGGSY